MTGKRRRRPPGPVAADRGTPLLRERVRAVYRRLPAALAGDADAIHDLRVASRRLRVGLPLLAGRPEGKRVTRALRTLRRITRTAGMSRDLDVAMVAFDTREGIRSPEAAVLRRRLRAARGRSRVRMTDALLDLEIARLRRDLRVVLRHGAEGLFIVLRRLRERRDVLGAEALALLDALGERYDTGSLHRLRTRLRQLRYMAELADAMRGSPSGAAEAFKVLQDELGQINDTEVLAAWLGRQEAAARARGQTALAAEAAAQRGHFREQARARHRALLQTGPRDAIVRALGAMAGGRAAASA